MELSPAPLICAPSTATLIGHQHASILGNAGQFAILVQINAGYLAASGRCLPARPACHPLLPYSCPAPTTMISLRGASERQAAGEGAESGEGKPGGFGMSPDRGFSGAQYA